jgi:hypothetical protein
MIDPRLQQQILRAIHEHVRYRMGFFLSDGGANQFSGTFLRNNNCHYVVTASHNIDEIKDPRTLGIATFRNQSGMSLATASGLRFLERGKKMHHPAIDVAILALSPAHVEELGVEWFDKDTCGSASALPGANVSVAGFPWELVRVTKGERLSAHPTPVVGFSRVADPRSLPPVSPPYEPDIEFLVEYDSSETRPGGLHPRGMSGCGVFTFKGLTNGQLWKPDVRLSGIQSAWVRSLKPPLLRAKRIEWVYRLLEELDP